jgi:hypothetical protein
VKAFLDHLAWARILIAAGTLPLLATAALPQARPMVPNIPCAEARRIVYSQGAAVLSTGPFTYDRFVSASAFCALGEKTVEPAWERALDTPQCFIGFRCRTGPFRQNR